MGAATTPQHGHGRAAKANTIVTERAVVHECSHAHAMGQHCAKQCALQ